jgi:uncharacterized membrane protein YkvA (DUF1232 family)
VQSREQYGREEQRAGEGESGPRHSADDDEQDGGTRAADVLMPMGRVCDVDDAATSGVAGVTQRRCLDRCGRAREAIYDEPVPRLLDAGDTMGRVTVSWWSVVAGAAGGVLLLWAALIVALWFVRPDELRIRDALRLLPDLVRLLRRLAGDRTLPRGVRIRLWLLLAYLALPFDLVPDFIPVIGYADDAVIVAFALRSVTRRAGPVALDRHWPGSPDGLEAVRRLAGLPSVS